MRGARGCADETNETTGAFTKGGVSPKPKASPTPAAKDLPSHLPRCPGTVNEHAQRLVFFRSNQDSKSTITWNLGMFNPREPMKRRQRGVLDFISEDPPRSTLLRLGGRAEGGTSGGAMGLQSTHESQTMTPRDKDGQEMVDGIPYEEHQRYYDELPWYAFPVANLFSDANLGAWSGISLVLFALKFTAVAAATNPTVAALVLCVSVLTALLWFSAFVLLGSKDHTLLYSEIPFHKFIQTFWIGAIACPLAVYAVRAVIGAAMTMIPMFATPEEVMYGGGGSTDYGEYGDYETVGADNTVGALFGVDGSAIAVAFVVAYLAAGLAEETAKYFGVARYYPVWDVLESDGTPQVVIAPPAGASANDDFTPKYTGTRRRAGCFSPAAGWFTPKSNPRVVVYLAFIVGLGFSFTENIQYGANVYEAATEWGKAGNVTMQRNVTLNPFADPFTDYEPAKVGSEEGEGEVVGDRVSAHGTKKMHTSTFGVASIGAVSYTAHDENLSLGKTKNENWLMREVFEVVSAALLSDYPEERVVESDVAPALDLAFRETMAVAQQAAKLSGEETFESDDYLFESAAVGKGKHSHLKTHGGVSVVDIFGADEPDIVSEITDEIEENVETVKELPSWIGQNITVNITVRRRPYTEEAKWAAATTVTALRGATPMHAVWAGLTATRYVTGLWITQTGYNVLKSIGWSWFYHGTFDFAIMAAPVLVANGASSEYVFTVLGIGFATIVWSWSHLVKATFALELDLMDQGLTVPNKGVGLPRLGLCTGSGRRTCFCGCLPCVGVLCPGMATWDVDELDEEDGGHNSYGATV